MSIDETDGSYEKNCTDKSKKKFKPVLATKKLKDRKMDKGTIRRLINLESFSNPEIQKLVKMNLDLIQAFSKGIEASRTMISALASSDKTKNKNLSQQLRTIEELSDQFRVSKYKNELNGVMKNLQSFKSIR